MAYSDRVVKLVGVDAIVKTNDIDRLTKNLGKKVGGRELLGRLADIYLAFIHQRHLNQGNGRWRPLSKRTIAGRRDKRLRPVTNESTRILIDTEQLLDVSAPSGRGQVRKLNISTMMATVGVDGTTVYHDPRINRTVKRKKLRDVKLKPPRRITLADLITFHANGEPGGHRRTIFVEPDATVLPKLKSEANAWINELLNARR
jgi:hypothetical protein